MFLGTFTYILFSREMTTTKYLQIEHLQSPNKREPNLKVNHEETVVNNDKIKFYLTENDYSSLHRLSYKCYSFLFYFCANIFFPYFVIYYAI